MADTRFTREEIDLFRQWFDAVEDLQPGYLESADHRLAHKLYRLLEMRPSNRLCDKAGEPQFPLGPELVSDDPAYVLFWSLSGENGYSNYQGVPIYNPDHDPRVVRRSAAAQ